MNADQIRQLSELLSAINSINGMPDRLYIGEAVVYDANDQPIAKLDYEDGEMLVLKQLLPE